MSKSNPWYVGKTFTGYRVPFVSKQTPTEASHGTDFRIVEGPFRNKQSAEKFSEIWNAGGQVTQQQIEHALRQMPPTLRERLDEFNFHQTTEGIEAVLHRKARAVWNGSSWGLPSGTKYGTAGPRDLSGRGIVMRVTKTQYETLRTVGEGGLTTMYIADSFWPDVSKCIDAGLLTIVNRKAGNAHLGRVVLTDAGRAALTA